MIKLLENLQNGFESVRSFQTSVMNDRVLKLAIGGTKLEHFHQAGVNALDIEKVEERYLLSGGKNGGICIHDLQNNSGKVAYEAKIVGKVPPNTRYSHKYSIETVQWYPFDTGIFVTSGMDMALQIFDTNTMKVVETIQMPYRINCHHMSPLTAQLAVAFQYHSPRLVDVRTASSSHELRGHKDHTPCLQWSPVCEHLLATASWDSRILFWDIRAAKSFLSTLDQHNGDGGGNRKDLVTAHNGAVNGLHFTYDGLHLVSCGTDGHVRLWDVALGTNTLVNYGSVVNNNKYKKVTMDICNDSSPPVLFVPSSNHILAYDLFSGERIEQMVGHFTKVNCVVYRSCVSQLLSSGNDMNILFWTPDVEKEKDETEDCQDSDNWSSDDDVAESSVQISHVMSRRTNRTF